MKKIGLYELSVIAFLLLIPIIGIMNINSLSLNPKAFQDSISYMKCFG